MSLDFLNEKVLLNTILANQIQKYLFPTFIIPKFFKLCIQQNTNSMESTMVSKWNLSKNWIYFLFFCENLSLFKFDFFCQLFLYKYHGFTPLACNYPYGSILECLESWKLDVWFTCCNLLHLFVDPPKFWQNGHWIP
jgi:hypothetical protein